jgi:hypothetical protein
MEVRSLVSEEIKHADRREDLRASESVYFVERTNIIIIIIINVG